MLADLPQPEWNEPHSLPAAFEAIRTAHNQTSAENAYNKLLYAVGNNHAGTYYPVVLSVVPVAHQVLSESDLWAKRATLDLLVDLVESFQPEPAYATFDDEPLRDLLMAKLRELVPLLRDLSRSEGTCLPQALQLLQNLQK